MLRSIKSRIKYQNLFKEKEMYQRRKQKNILEISLILAASG